jgi:hypothetical protein
LYSEEREILFAGDHVLPSISPNIAGYSTEPNANPLDEYLRTLPPFLTLSENTLVLLLHKQSFYGLHSSVRKLIEHHHLHLIMLTYRLYHDQ